MEFSRVASFIQTTACCFICLISQRRLLHPIIILGPRTVTFPFVSRAQFPIGSRGTFSSNLLMRHLSSPVSTRRLSQQQAPALGPSFLAAPSLSSYASSGSVCFPPKYFDALMTHIYAAPTPRLLLAPTCLLQITKSRHFRRIFKQRQQTPR